MRAFLFLLCVLVCGVATAVPRAQNARLGGFVTDSGGAAISKAEIFVHWDPSGSTMGLTSNVGIKEDLRLTTNYEGRFWADIPPGFYDIFVSAAGFSPDCRKIRLKQGGSAGLSIALKISPLVGVELGDKVFANPK